MPDIVAGGDGSGGGLVNVLLGNMISQDRASRQAARATADEKPDSMT